MRLGWLFPALLVCLGLHAADARAEDGIRAEDGVLERVRRNGFLRCGASLSGTGLAVMDEQGRWQGFYVDLCRAVAAAVTGSADNLEIMETTSANRFTVLTDGNADMTVAGTTWTLEREGRLGIAFPVIQMHDGQGFMAHRSLGVSRLAEVRGATVCVIAGTTTQRTLERWAAANPDARLTIRTAQSTDGALTAFFNHHCDLMTNDRISLFAQRLLKAPVPSDYVILPDVISREPLSPAVAAGDERWARIVRWVVLAMIAAEEMGVGSVNAAALKGRTDIQPEARRLLGTDPGVGAPLGLDDGWALRVLTAVGNYGEVFERHLGHSSPLDIDRGMNDLWTRGGLLFAPPLGG